MGFGVQFFSGAAYFSDALALGEDAEGLGFTHRR